MLSICDLFEASTLKELVKGGRPANTPSSPKLFQTIKSGKSSTTPPVKQSGKQMQEVTKPAKSGGGPSTPKLFQTIKK